MVHCGQESVCIRRQVDPSGGGLELEHGADEGWVLVGEAIVLLAGPGAGFDVVDTANGAMPRGLLSLEKKR